MTIIASQTTPASSGESLFNLKALLKLAGWTVAESGTGNAGTGSGVYNASGDAITTAALMTNSLAWYRIHTPLGSGSGPEFVIQNSTNNSGQINFWYTAYGTSSPGTASALPTLVNGTQLRSAGGARQMPSGVAYRLWCVADNAAPYGMWFGTIPVGGGNANSVTALCPLSSFNVGDPNPYMLVNTPSGNFNANGPLWSGVTSFASGVDAACLNVGYLPPPAATNLQIIPGFLPTNQSFAGGNIVLPATAAGGGYGTDPITGKDALFPIMYARSLSLTLPTWKGVTTWMRWKGTVRTNGDTGTLNTTRDLIHMADVVLPWDGSVPIL
jgi:hypothetical protein